ncbi:phenoloxidase-activating enzyme-like [Zerene cesonia]|uniref:phenoloxidase-activating enzyme-like n=1 Tax=Zerene cesonia TaxID=33412 RepID=UPI0018E58AA8|nr:phenoloxidase-activating enzyme-like [Zerene cesonia]
MVPLILLLFVSYANGEFDADCITPTGLPSHCVSLNECDKLKPLIRRPAEERETLKQWHCGFEGDVPTVCCPPTSPKSQCFTPLGTPGICVAQVACASIMKLLKPPISRETLDFVSRSKCKGPSELNVCCEEPFRVRTPIAEDKDKIQASSNNPTDAPIFDDNIITAMTAPDVFITPNPITIDDTSIPDVDNVLPLSIDRVDKFDKRCKDAGIPEPNSGCCGIDSAGGNRIFGGNETAIDQYPWLALIEYASKALMCGGSLISRRYVLTAAHCLVRHDMKKRDAVSVRLGDYNITNDGYDCIEVDGDGNDCNQDPVTIRIEQTILHPEYKIQQTVMEANDIALIRLQESVKYSDFIRPICLPFTDSLTPPPSGLYLYAAGWGAVSETVSTSEIKFHVDLPFTEPSVCSKLYSIRGKPIIWDRQICAGGELNKDSCKGDSGGPLMRADDKTYEVVGITSFGIRQCGNKGRPSVYTKVYAYMDWIKSEVKP